MDEGLYKLQDAWRMALQKEADSRQLYARMAQMSKDPSIQTLFNFLAGEERRHYDRLQTEYARVFEHDMAREKERARIPWLDWDEDSFQLAKDLDKPILLDISAVWCHWCHVMDQTTYDDPEVAALVNAEYVPIRVDNDKRPDVNARYNMGGWPTTAFLTPEGEVITGATYVQPEQMKALLQQIASYYRQNKADIQGRVATAQARRRLAATALPASGLITPALVDSVVQAAVDAYDPLYGGFGTEPKFPHTEALELLLAVAQHKGEAKLLERVTHTLTQMAHGGLYDPVMGGFFRYSTTRDWRIPHYEKMAEDNAKLATLYLHAYQATGNDDFRQTARGIIGYVESTLFDPLRGYFAGSQDADEAYYRLERAGREARPAPFVDWTVYTNWNALLASACLEAASVLEEPRYRQMALRTLDFLWQTSYNPERGMYHYFEQSPHLEGQLNDQVRMAAALMDAYEHTGQADYLAKAETLAQLIPTLWGGNGALYDTAVAPQALGRIGDRLQPITDNGLAAQLFARLYHLTHDESYKQAAANVLGAFVEPCASYGLFAADYALAVEWYLRPPLAITVVGSGDDPATSDLLRQALKVYAPQRVVGAVDPLWEKDRLAALGYPPEPAPVAYVCSGQVCGAPVSDPSQIAAAVAALRRNRPG
ncbi:MAG: DUF255 domain-containing protein [Chloroflexi bacterium]|nr:DUF255 domain-containing protein [Chloroflexota bacterium]